MSEPNEDKRDFQKTVEEAEEIAARHKSAAPYCPVHDHPDNDPEEVPWPWSRCPVATEDDPPEKESCPYFIAELERRRNEVVVRGHYYELLPVGPDGERRVQEYRNHRPVGKPRPLGG